MSEVELVVDRVRLYCLKEENPHWSKKELAKQMKRSVSWVGKWLKRYQDGAPNDPSIFLSRSRARKTANKKVLPAVEKAILEIRDHPLQSLHRIPGPKTILYYLHQQAKELGEAVYLPTSTATVWRILEKHQRIYRPSRGKRVPQARPEPMTHWQADFKTVSSVPPAENGKKQHVVETFNLIDTGTSILVSATSRGDYHAATVFTALIDTFSQSGLPERITFDRDSRFVGSWTSREFPSALMRFLYALGISPQICPPHRPDKNAFVERYHRSYQEECLNQHRPTTLAQVIEVTETYARHYNYERPHQGISCDNQPPRLALPDAATQRRLPEIVNPDAWLKVAAKKPYGRRVNANGSIQIGGYRYYVSKKLAKREVLLRLHPQEKQLLVYVDDCCRKRIPLKGLYEGELPLADYIESIQKEALSEARRLLAKRRRKQHRH